MQSELKAEIIRLNDANQSIPFARLMWTHFRKTVIFACCLLVGAGVAIFFSLDVAGLLGVLSFFVLATALIPITKIVHRDKSDRIAASLGYVYEPLGELSSLSGPLFNAGYSRKICDVFTGEYAQHPIRLFTYEFTKGSGEHATTYRYSLFEMTFSHELPPMSAISLYSQIVAYSVGEEEVSLEGNFHNYYEVRCARDKQIEIRQLLTPDNMAELIDKKPFNGFFTSSNKFYLCLNHGLYHPTYRDVDSLAKEWALKWTPHLERMKW